MMYSCAPSYLFVSLYRSVGSGQVPSESLLRQLGKNRLCVGGFVRNAGRSLRLRHFYAC